MINRLLKSRRPKLKLALTGITVLAALIAIILLARPIDNKTDKIQPDWSRGTIVGRSPFSQQPGMAASADGKHIHLAWPDNGPHGTGVHYIRMNEHTQRVAEQWVEGLAGTPMSVQVVLDEQERPHVFAVSRLRGQEIQRLIHWSSADDAKRTTPQTVSPADVAAESYAVALRQGAFDLLWTANPDSDARGVYYTRLDASGQVIAERRLNQRPAEQVYAQADRSGGLHAVWVEMVTSTQWQVFYAAFPTGEPQPTDGITMTRSDAFPKLGLDGQRVYILWGREVKGGMMAGMGFTAYVSFPLGHPESATQESLYIPESGQPEYIPYQGEYKLNLADATLRTRSDFTNLLHSPAPAAGQHDVMAIAAIAALSFGLNEGIVPALVIFQDGKAVGYQVIGYNQGFNTRPVLAADKSGHLYAVWLTGSTGAGFRMYYAATTPAARARQDRGDLTDLLVGTTVVFWRMLGGLALLPIFPLVVLPGLLIAVGYSVFGSGETLYERRSYGVLIAACLAYWIAKEFVLGAVLADPAIGRELTGWNRTILIWGIQLVIAGVSGWFTWRQIARERTDSVFWATLIFILCDMVLTMLVFGPTLALRG